MRPLLAVVAGVALWGGAWTGSHAALAGALPAAFDERGFPRDAGLLLAFLAISVVLSIVAGFVAAWIARARPMRVVAVLAVLQLAIGVAVQASSWEAMPVWYHVPFLLMVVPAHLLGGWMKTGRAPSAVAGASA